MPLQRVVSLYGVDGPVIIVGRNPVQKSSPLPPVLLRLLQVVGTAIAFAIMNRVGWYFQIDQGVSIFYPATAIDVIACMHFGPWGALGVFLGCVGTPWQTGETLQMTAVSGMLNVIEGMLPYLVFRFTRNLHRDLHDFRSLVAFLIYGCIVNSAVSAAAGNLILIPPPVTLTNLFTWWVSDFTAALLLGMPLLAFAGGLLERITGAPEQRPSRTLANAVEITATITLLGWFAATAVNVYLTNTFEQQQQEQQRIWSEASRAVGNSQASSVRAAFAELDARNQHIAKVYGERRQRIRTVTLLMQQTLLVILLLAGVNLVVRIARPLRETHKEVLRLREGKPFDATHVASDLVELRELAETLDQTAGELRAREEALRDQTARAVAASNAKSEFLAKMSHELRTPLNSIIGFSDILVERSHSVSPEKLESFVQNISRSAHNLLRMINDLLDVAKVEAGKLEFRYDVTDIRQLIEDSVVVSAPLFRGKEQIVEVELQDVPMRVRVDPGRTEQIFLNLLSNANKFSPERTTIHIAARVDGSSCIVKIRDEGIGIRTEDQGFVFEDFAQVHQPRRATGTGLGLGLARRFAELQGGTLSLESELGKGSTFTLVFPLHRAMSQAV